MLISVPIDNEQNYIVNGIKNFILNIIYLSTSHCNILNFEILHNYSSS